MQPAQSKVCTQCRLDIPLGDYYKQKGGVLGYSSCCKKCYRARNMTPEKLKARSEQRLAKANEGLKAKKELKAAEDYEMKPLLPTPTTMTKAGPVVICTRCNTVRPLEEIVARELDKDEMTVCNPCAKESVKKSLDKGSTRPLEIVISPTNKRPESLAIQKACMGCKQTKPLSSFGVNSKSPDFASSRCKTCVKDKSDRKKASTAEFIRSKSLF